VENSVAKAASSITAGPAAVDPRANDRHANYDKGRLFLVSVIALVTAGMSSVFFVLPQMGKAYDHYKAQAGEVTASQMSFRLVAVFPAVLLIVFGAIWLYDRSNGDSSLPGSLLPKNGKPNSDGD
jgi:hypothetical protein